MKITTSIKASYSHTSSNSSTVEYKYILPIKDIILPPHTVAHVKVVMSTANGTNMPVTQITTIKDHTGKGIYYDGILVFEMIDNNGNDHAIFYNNEKARIPLPQMLSSLNLSSDNPDILKFSTGDKDVPGPYLQFKQTVNLKQVEGFSEATGSVDIEALDGSKNGDQRDNLISTKKFKLIRKKV